MPETKNHHLGFSERISLIDHVLTSWQLSPDKATCLKGKGAGKDLDSQRINCFMGLKFSPHHSSFIAVVPGQ